MHLSDREHEQS